MAEIKEAIRRLIYQYVTEGADKLIRDQEAVAASTTKTDKASLSLEKSFGNLERRYVDTVRVQQDYVKVLEKVNAAVTQNPALQERANVVLAAATKRFEEASGSTQKLGQQVGLARHELINLGRQAQDVGVSLVSGQSPLMVLAQQGSQIADVFISSGKSVREFFGQAISWAGRFLSSPAGIVAGIAAIGTAAVYAASQFLSASKSVEQVITEENRLRKETLALIDAKTSAEAKAQAQMRGQTQYQVLRNEEQAWSKLKDIMEEVANLAEQRSTRPTGGGMPEMGIAPSGIAPLEDPGYAKIKAAVDALRVAIDKAQPGLKEFNAELGRIGEDHVELRTFIDKLMEMGPELENTAVRAKALKDLLAGIATDAQHAVLGLGSIAQKKLSDLGADQAREATERMAQAVLQMAQAYPGMSIEIAKQLDALRGQLAVAEQSTGLGKMQVQHQETITSLLLQGRTLTEAIAVADAQRALALAQITAAHEAQMVALQGQLAVAQQITGIGQINAQHEVTINTLKQEGLTLSQATAQADLQRALALAQVNAAAQQRLRDLQNEMALIRAVDDIARERIQSEQTLNKLLEQGVEFFTAQAVAAQELANATERRAQQEYEVAKAAMETAQAKEAEATAAEKSKESWGPMAKYSEDAADSTQQAASAAARVTNETAQWVQNVNAASRATHEWIEALPLAMSIPLSFIAPYQEGKTAWNNYTTQFNPAGYTSQTGYTQTMMFALTSLYGEGGFDKTSGKPNTQGMETVFNKQLGKAGGDFSTLVNNMLSGDLTSRAITGTNAIDMNMISLVNRAIELLPDEQQKISAYEREVGILQQQPASLANSELIQQLNQKLEQLKTATDANTDATSAMTDVLSPFYSSDPRKTHLGFRSFAGGGIMTEYGALPLRQYQGGGMATSPQVAVFGEGSTPEAYVPVPSGKIPVELKQPANSNQRPVQVTINVMGNATPDTVAALKSTAFQQAQAMRRVVG